MLSCAVGSIIPPLTLHSSLSYSDDSLDSLTSSSTSGLSPRLLQLSNQMSRAYFLEFILHDKKARRAFRRYLEKRHCVENLMFWYEASTGYPAVVTLRLTNTLLQA